MKRTWSPAGVFARAGSETGVGTSGGEPTFAPGNGRPQFQWRSTCPVALWSSTQSFGTVVSSAPPLRSNSDDSTPGCT